MSSSAHGVQAFWAQWSCSWLVWFCRQNIQILRAEYWDSAGRIWIFCQQNIVLSHMIYLHIYTSALYWAVTQFCQQNLSIFSKIFILYWHIYFQTLGLILLAEYPNSDSRILRFCYQILDTLSAEYFAIAYIISICIYTSTFGVVTRFCQQNMDILLAEYCAISCNISSLYKSALLG